MSAPVFCNGKINKTELLNTVSNRAIVHQVYVQVNSCFPETIKHGLG